MKSSSSESSLEAEVAEVEVRDDLPKADSDCILVLLRLLLPPRFLRLPSERDEDDMERRELCLDELRGLDSNRRLMLSSSYCVLLPSDEASIFSIFFVASSMRLSLESRLDDLRLLRLEDDDEDCRLLLLLLLFLVLRSFPSVCSSSID